MPAPFAPAVTLSQSADGTAVIVTDTSNYASNSDSVTLLNIISRTVTSTDGLGNLINVFSFSPGLLTQTFTITKDYYLDNALSFVIPGPRTRTATVNSLLPNFYLNAAREVARSLRCCSNTLLCNNAVKADAAYNEAVTSTLFIVPSEAQNAIDDANSLISQEVCGC